MIRPTCLLLFTLLLTLVLTAQTTTDPICENDDCSDAVNAIQLDAPVLPGPGGYDAVRTSEFEAAYRAFKRVKEGHRSAAEWQGKYRRNELGGANCLRYYDLESRFAHEYEKNPAFKSFIDGQENDTAGFQKDGFESSRRRLNLTTRFGRKCPRQQRNAEKEGLTSEDESKAIYDKLGQVQGYWDEKGNILKELETIPEKEEEPEQKISKKDQAELLTKTVNNPPPEQDGQELAGEVEKLKKQEGLKQQLADLEPTEEYAKRVAECEEELKGLLGGLTKVTEKKEKTRKGLGKLLALPGKLIGKVTGFIEKHTVFKTLLNAIPGVSNIVNVVDGLFGKSKLLAGALELITGKQSKLTETLNGIAGRVDEVRDKYEEKVSAVNKIKDQISDFAEEKTGLLDILSKKIEDLSPVEQQVIDLVKKHQLLGENSACNELEPIKEEIEALDEELDEIEPQIEEMEEELDELAAETAEIEAATDKVEEQVNEAVEQTEEVRAEEKAIKEEFGTDVELEPVTVEEWSESFEVERPYWEATFHPDDEVVEGYRGRYFRVQLKDADKAIRLLFGPGEYFTGKSDFRDKYGSVIGVFVTEALAAIKKGDREAVKLFVQGSADISGASSFRGNLDESFYYDELILLPLKGRENFGGTEESRTVREKGFTNEDLPNLRGQFMKEMISVYSKKLQPILLEGSVKKQVDAEDRNAIIYLFLPDSLLEE